MKKLICAAICAMLFASCTTKKQLYVIVISDKNTVQTPSENTNRYSDLFNQADTMYTKLQEAAKRATKQTNSNLTGLHQ